MEVMPEPTNLLGAVIFWSYIFAALAFTYLALETIVKTPTSRPRHAWWSFAVLALFSFSTLSANMLNVLILSYKLWAANQFPHQDVLDTLSLDNIWQWSLHSRLFRDFGEAIVKNDARFLWTQSALLATNSVCLFMGSEGLRRRIPRLWTFFALSQILPISFAQNLFYIAVIRSPAMQNEVVLSRDVTIRITAVYCVCLMVAPYAAEGPYLIPTILFARILLLLPVIMPMEKQPINSKQVAAGGSVTLSFTHAFAQGVLGTLATAMTVYRMYLLFTQGASVGGVGKALFSHPAVTALGWDFLVCSASFCIWTLTSSEGTGIKERSG